MDLKSEKKDLFRDAVRYADKADDKLIELFALPELYGTFTDEQIEAMREYQKAFRKLLSVFWILTGRGK